MKSREPERKRVKRKPKGKCRAVARKIIRRATVRDKTGYSDTTIWRLERKGLFPSRLLLSEEGGAVGWYEDEVDLWIQTRVRQGGKRPLVQWRGGTTQRQGDGEDPRAASSSEAR
jgi:predicted DNA-binding transcriptional regulator AlpA